MLWVIIAMLVIIADQITKALVTTYMSIGDTAFSVLNLFDITYVQNRGAAFSILSGKMWFLSVVSVLFCVILVIYCIKAKPTQPIFCLSLTMLFGGAFANAIDRIFRGFVVDFINASFITFPVFNIADMAITIGAILLIVYYIFLDKEEQNADVKN